MLAFRLAVRIEVSVLRSRKLHMITGFFYPKVVETSMSFKDLFAALKISSSGCGAKMITLHALGTEEAW